MEVRKIERVVITLTTFPDNLNAKELEDITNKILDKRSRKDLLQVDDVYVSIYEDTTKVEAYNDTIKLSFSLYSGDANKLAAALQNEYEARTKEYSKFLLMEEFAHEHGRKSTKPGNGKYFECQ
jgi:hypothetical protein